MNEAAAPHLFGVPYEIDICSATLPGRPANSVPGRGARHLVIIAGSWWAAHLAGVIARRTILPSSPSHPATSLGGLDALAMCKCLPEFPSLPSPSAKPGHQRRHSRHFRSSTNDPPWRSNLSATRRNSPAAPGKITQTAAQPCHAKERLEESRHVHPRTRLLFRKCSLPAGRARQWNDGLLNQPHPCSIFPSTPKGEDLRSALFHIFRVQL